MLCKAQPLLFLPRIRLLQCPELGPAATSYSTPRGLLILKHGSLPTEPSGCTRKTSLVFSCKGVEVRAWERGFTTTNKYNRVHMGMIVHGNPTCGHASSPIFREGVRDGRVNSLGSQDIGVRNETSCWISLLASRKNRERA